LCTCRFWLFFSYRSVMNPPVIIHIHLSYLSLISP
jgi:hypothetical protein